MTSPNLYRRLALFAGAVATSLVPLAVPASASGEDERGVIVESGGDPASAMVLPPAPVVGQTVTQIATVNVSISVADQNVDVGIELTYTSAVVEVGDGGSYVSESTIDKIDLIAAPAGVDGPALGYDDLVGVRVRQEVEPSGRVVSSELIDAEALDPTAREAFEGFAGNLQSAQIAYPVEAVGVGAIWTSVQEIATEGFTLPVTYRYELTGIADGRYELTISYSSAFETTIEGSAATGTVAGLGSASGSIDNPLDVSVEFGQTIDASAEGVDLAIVIDLSTATSGTAMTITPTSTSTG